MKGATWVWVKPNFVLTVLLLAIPCAAAQDPTDQHRILANDGVGDTYLKGLDLVRIEGATQGDTIELRLALEGNADPEERVEQLGTALGVFAENFRLHGELQKVGGTQTYVAEFVARSAFQVQMNGLGPTIAGQFWSFGLNVWPGDLTTVTADDRVAIAVTAEVKDASIRWQIQRSKASADAGILSPNEAWVLSNLYGESRFHEPVSEGTVAWAADRSLSDTWGSDRVPDTGYAYAFAIPAVREDTPQQQQPTPSSGQPKKDPSHEVHLLPIRFSGAAATHEEAYLSFGTLTLIGIALLVAARPRVLYLAILPLFTRIVRDEALDHPRRALMVEAIRVSPGITFSELRSVLGTGSGLLMHHLAVLEGQELIRSVEVRGRRRFYLSSQKTNTLASQTTEEKVLGIVNANPGRPAADLARATGVSRTAALYHLKHLEAAGVVRSEKAGKFRRFFPA